MWYERAIEIVDKMDELRLECWIKGIPPDAERALQSMSRIVVVDCSHPVSVTGRLRLPRGRVFDTPQHITILHAPKSPGLTGKTVAAICHGGWMLCSVPETIRGRKATSFMAIRHDMTNAGAEYLDQEVVVDGPIITSRKPDDLPAFCRAIMARLIEEGDSQG